MSNVVSMKRSGQWASRQERRKDGFRKCTGCEEWKPEVEFRKYNVRRYECGACHQVRKSSEQRTRKGIVHENFDKWYANQLAMQNGICAMDGCGRPVELERYGRFQPDHNHTTGKLRALLCMKCNIHLGVYEKNKVRYEAYLEKYDGA